MGYETQLDEDGRTEQVYVKEEPSCGRCCDTGEVDCTGTGAFGGPCASRRPCPDCSAATVTTIAEPDDGVAMYWPCTAEVFPSLFLRDDATAAGLGHPERRWFEPNADKEAQTWQEVLAAVGRMRLDLADAVRLVAPSNGAEVSEELNRHG